jgi:hypothetical protein
VISPDPTGEIIKASLNLDKIGAFRINIDILKSSEEKAYSIPKLQMCSLHYYKDKLKSLGQFCLAD